MCHHLEGGVRHGPHCIVRTNTGDNSRGKCTSAGLAIFMTAHSSKASSREERNFLHIVLLLSADKKDAGIREPV